MAERQGPVRVSADAIDFRQPCQGLPGFQGVAPPATTGTYTLTNVATLRTGDADTLTTAQVADVLGTLIADLRALGLVN